MIVFDTETTGLIKAGLVPIQEQPYIVEFAACELDDLTLEVIDEITFLCKPPIPMPPEASKISGITDEMLKTSPPFAAFLSRLQDFFLGEDTMVAHNCPYDRGMLELELRRLDALNRFPWPSKHLCTVELTTDITGKWMKQDALYLHYMKTPANQTHRALDDVHQLCDIVRHMRKEHRL